MCNGSNIRFEVCGLLDCSYQEIQFNSKLSFYKKALEWGSWLPWSKCGWIGNCGKDVAIRLRSCKDGSGACFGSPFDITSCYGKSYLMNFSFIKVNNLLRKMFAITGRISTMAIVDFM